MVRKPRVLRSRPFDQNTDLAAALLSRHRTKRGLGDQVSSDGLVPSGAPSVAPDSPALGSEPVELDRDWDRALFGKKPTLPKPSSASRRRILDLEAIDTKPINPGGFLRKSKRLLASN
jgi:hypothetical protein